MNLTSIITRSCARKLEGQNNLYILKPENKYAAIFQQMVASGILHDVDHDPQIVSIIVGQLQLVTVDDFFIRINNNNEVSKRLF